MGSVLPAPCSGDARRTVSVGRTVWVMVLVVLAGLAVASGQALAQENDYSSHLDNQQRNATNASDGLSSPRQSFASKYFKCRCEGNQVWDGSQCNDTQTKVWVMLPATQSVALSLTDDFAGVTVREVQCPPDYAEVHLDTIHSPSYHFFLLSNGMLSWQQREYEHYCLEHTLDTQGNYILEARVCLPPPPIPSCCPGSITSTADVLSCSKSFTLPFSPPVMTGEKFTKWPKLVKKTVRKCKEFEKGLNVSLNSGKSNLLYESGEVSLEWKAGYNLKNKQKDGFCVMPQEGGGYVATVCYEDHEAIHRSLCKHATCVRKCCPKGEIHGTQDCVHPKSDADLWKPSFADFDTLSDMPPPKDLQILYGSPHCPLYLADPQTEEDKFYVLGNGFLFTPAISEKDPPTRYCIDNFLNADNTVSVKALVCFDEAQVEPVCAIAKKTLYPVLLIVSSVFLGITLAVYLSMPDLRTKLHGRCLISLASSFFVAYVLMSVSYLSDSLSESSVCIALGFFKQLSLLGAFFWLNVMCFDIWRTLRKTRMADSGRWALRRFLWYCLYTWGCSLTIAITTVIVQLLPSSFHVIRPNFINDACWLSGTPSLWLYLYMWVSLLVTANIVFFGLVLVILVKGQNNSLLRRSREMNRERMWLYAKLFLVMGVTWMAEMISHENGKCVGWIFTDIINALQGLTLFLVFILNRSTLRKIKQKWCCGSPQPLLSPSNTLSSTVSSSSGLPSKKAANLQISVSSRFSNTSTSIKDLNIESSIPLNTLSEAPEEYSNNEPQKYNPVYIGGEKEALNPSNGDA